jgi:hypothetical protein
MILIDVWCFSATFSNISVISWRPAFSGGRSRSTQREPPTIGKQLVSYIITCAVSRVHFVWIVHFRLPHRYSLTFICPLSCVPYVSSFSGLSFYITPSVFSNMNLSCVLCILSCQFLWIVLFHYPSVFSNMYFSCVLCTLCCQFLWIVLFHYPFGIL